MNLMQFFLATALLIPSATHAQQRSMHAVVGPTVTKTVGSPGSVPLHLAGLPDIDALRMAHEAYFAGFPHDRKAVLSLGVQGNVFAAVMLERTWQLADYGEASSGEAQHWRDIAVAGHAMARLSALAAQGDANAMLWLGSVQRYGLLQQAEDVVKSFAWYLKSAEHGNAFAQNIAGWMYESGEGVAKDEVETVRWWRKAAEQGNAMGQESLGRSYYYGYGVAKDLGQAMSWWRKAAEQGNALAQSELGSAYYFEGKDAEQAVNWWRKAAEQGIAQAQYNLGLAYYLGLGVAKDPVESVRWYSKAAGQGYALAQFNLGGAYVQGVGVAKDAVEAMRWYRKSAEQGNASAQTALGSAYYFGNGVDKDFEQAVRWWRKAAEQGDASAQFNLGSVYEQGVGVAKDAVEAMRWYRKSAEQGNANARSRLANDVCEIKQKGGLNTQTMKSPEDVLRFTEWIEKAGPSPVEQDMTSLRGISAEKRIELAEAFFSRLNGKTYVNDGDGSWSDDKLFVVYHQYNWCGPSGNWIDFGDVFNNGNGGFRFIYQLDAATGFYRDVESRLDTLVETVMFPLQNGSMTEVSYTINKRGKRSKLGQTNYSIASDGRLTATGSSETTTSSPIDHGMLPQLAQRVKQAESDRLANKKHGSGGGFLRSLVGAAVGVAAGKASGASGEQVLGAALAGASTFNPDSAAAQTLGAAGEGLITGNSGGSASGVGALADGSSGGSYRTKPNLALGACAGFTEDNYRQKALSGGGDQQLYTMCGQAFEYYTMYKRAIAQGYSQADANRTYAAHEQAAQVAQGFLNSHGAD